MLTSPRETRRLWERTHRDGVSIRHRLALYWITMALTALAAALLLLSATGVTSRAARQFGETLELQQRNSAAALAAQMDALTARGVTLSQEVGGELTGFLARRGVAFEALNDDPALIAELEETLFPVLESALGSSPCSGVYLCLDATANTTLPEAERSRMGLYLRYSSLRSADPQGNVTFFRGAVAAARQQGIPLHNRWNPELDTGLIPGYRQVMAWSGERLADGCLWTERVPLLDTWEDVTLLCVPVLDEGGTVRGVCGMELSGLYFSLSHGAVESRYGSFLTLLAPLDGSQLRLDKAMLGDTGGTVLTAEGTLEVKRGRYYDTFTGGGETYLGTYQIVSGRLADGLPLAAVTLVPEEGYRSYAGLSRLYWVLGSLAFLAAMLAAAFVLSRRFVQPITESLAAVRRGTESPALSGISEIDELLAFLRSRPQESDALPPEIETLFADFAQRSAALTGTERSVLKLYAQGCTIGEIPERMFISASTVKTHNRNLYAKLGVSSYDELRVYLDLFRRCGRLDELLRPPPP